MMLTHAWFRSVGGLLQNKTAVWCYNPCLLRGRLHFRKYPLRQRFQLLAPRMVMNFVEESWNMSKYITMVMESNFSIESPDIHNIWHEDAHWSRIYVELSYANTETSKIFNWNRHCKYSYVLDILRHIFIM